MFTTATTTQVEVDDLELLRALPGLVQDLAGQAREIVAHAGTWVCATEGFRPSPVCALRPLVPVLGRLEEAFNELGSDLVVECERVARGVERAHAELVGADAAAVSGLAAPRLQLVRLHVGGLDADRLGQGRVA